MWSAVTGVIAIALGIFFMLLEFYFTLALRKLKTLTEVLLVIAHPDDEVMFFLPTILAMRVAGVKFHCLCLCSGDNDAIGKIRTEEFRRVSVMLGHTKHTLLNNPKLKDGWHEWDSQCVVSEISAYLEKNSGVKDVISFDIGGVSGHPNHISIFNAISVMAKTRLTSSVRFHVLETVPVWRKFLPPIDILIVSAQSMISRSNEASSDFPGVVSNVVMLSGVYHYMREYASQFVWFRRLYAFGSRYAYVNTFRTLGHSNKVQKVD